MPRTNAATRHAVASVALVAIVAVLWSGLLSRSGDMAPTSSKRSMESAASVALPTPEAGGEPTMGTPRLLAELRLPATALFVLLGVWWTISMGLLARLADGELTLVVAHELAHLERRDDWSDLAQRLLTALFFFHPAVWWLSRRLDLERELACDEWALARTGASPRQYARCLVSVGNLVLGRRAPAGAPSMATRLGTRIDTLLVRPPTGRPAAATGRVALVALVLALAVAVLGRAPSFAVGESALPRGGTETQAAAEQLATELASLGTVEPARRALAAYRLGQMRRHAEAAIPQLVELLDETSPVARQPGLTSRYWGRPSERRRTTTVAEEALKALLYIGPASIGPLEKAISQTDLRDDPFAVWALELLRQFD